MAKGKGNPVYSYVTEKLIAAINEGGLLPWQKPWNGLRPMNLISKKPYRGINILLLAFTKYGSPFWLTEKQCKSLGGSILPDQARTMITYWQISKYRETAGGREWLPATATGPNIKKSFMLRYYYVYNVEQCTGIPAEKIPTLTRANFNPIEKCQAAWEGYQNRPKIEFVAADRACYSPLSDSIQMPNPNQFKQDEAYYSTLFHEAVHSTGHANRLNRDGIAKFNGFGSEEYAKEELIGEIGAAFLCAETGIENATLDRSASYLNNWLGRLKNDPRLLVSAASLAEKAVDYILNNVEATVTEETEELAGVAE